MKIPAIKKLVENYSLEDLEVAENDLSEGCEISLDVDGDDEGEQLTHIIAASWILQKMNDEDVDFKTALREYTTKVRKSIS